MSLEALVDEVSIFPNTPLSEHEFIRTFAALRQAPPQRVLFQPDTAAASRQTRQISNQAASPAPQPGVYSAANGLGNSNASSAALNGYEPKRHIPLTLFPLMTPGNNPDQFKANQKALRDAMLAMRSKVVPPVKGMMLPGSKWVRFLRQNKS